MCLGLAFFADISYHKVGNSLIPCASIFLCPFPLPHSTSSKILEVDCSVYLYDCLLNNFSFPGYRTDEAVEFALVCLYVWYLRTVSMDSAPMAFKFLFYIGCTKTWGVGHVFLFPGHRYLYCSFRHYFLLFLHYRL